MKIYDKNAFTSSLSKSKKLYCSNDLTFGLRLLPVEYALKHKYIQANHDRAIMFLVIDLDHNNPLMFQDVGLPAPNFCVIDNNKSTSHYVYALSTPIPKNYADDRSNKALNLFAKIQQEYTRLLNGDPLYAGMIAKNPLNQHWKTWNSNPYYAYDLYELAESIELPQRLTKREAIGEGRNCWLFDVVRKFAYKEVLFYKVNGATEADFYNVILNRLEKSNVFERSLPLGFNELKNIAKSISKWVWANFSAEKFSAIQRTRGKRGGKKSTRKLSSVRDQFKHEFSYTTP